MTGRLGNKWGLPRRVYRTLARNHNRTWHPPFDFDSPDRCMFGPDYWHGYHTQHYDYQYNSWGFRGPDYEQYQGQPVNICIGDSVTVNLGGPVHHSWCSKLAKFFDIPTLNFGIDDLGCFDVPSVVERVRSTFRVQHLFVLYNLQTADTEPIHETVVTRNNNHNIDHKLWAFERYAMVPGVIYQFDPPWTFGTADRQALYRLFPRAHAYLDKAVIDPRTVRLQDLAVIAALANKYQELAGPGWPTYLEFCQRFITGEDMTQAMPSRSDQGLMRDYLRVEVWPVVQRLILANRDGWHLSEYANSLLAEHFCQEALTKK